jgi:hypothetical protein
MRYLIEVDVTYSPGVPIQSKRMDLTADRIDGMTDLIGETFVKGGVLVLHQAQGQVAVIPVAYIRAIRFVRVDQ